MIGKNSDVSLIGGKPSGGPIQVFMTPHQISARLPRISHGKGIYMWDDTGRRYIDVSSGPVTNNIGHANPRVLAAMQAQAEKVAFAFPGIFESEANEKLADLLTDLAGPGFERAFFVSGGSEAIETAIKLCRQYALAVEQPSKWKVISREPGYHGGTLGALSLTGDRVQHEVFGPMLKAMPKVPTPFTYRLPPNHSRESYARECAQALEDKVQTEGEETVLAFIMEPVGGLATGALVAEDVYMEMVRDICTRYGVLLIFDEVMSGAGRTGKFLAADHWPNAKPDIVVLAKGIAAGYTPMGSVLAPNTIVKAVADAGGFMNAFTYFANPLSCAIGHAVLQEMVNYSLVLNAEKRGAQLKSRLLDMAKSNRIIGDVRGLGLLLAVELVTNQDSKTQIPLDLQAPALFQKIAMDMGLATYCRRTSGGAYGDWLMISPPLITNEEQVDEIANGLEAALAEFECKISEAGH